MKFRLGTLILATVCSIGSLKAQVSKEPGGTAEDEATAINDPYQYAWHLFFYLNQQAKIGVAGAPDESKKSFRDYDDDKPVVWETWASATGGLDPSQPNTSEVYMAKGVKPVDWALLSRESVQTKIFEPTLTEFQAQIRSFSLRGMRDLKNEGNIKMTPFFLPNGTDPTHDDEIRINKTAYNYIRDNYLYSAEGLQTAAQKAIDTGNRSLIAFPAAAKEIKARWIQIAANDRPRYHWRSLKVTKADGTIETQYWGLAGLHIVTKDLPNWFWTDFEHVDEEPQDIKDNRPSIDPTTRSNLGVPAPSGHDGIRDETQGTKWAYYRLRGIQINFTDQFGKPTQLANSLIEPLENGPSSCITCHAKATTSLGIKQNARPPFVITTLPPEFIDGLPDPSRFFGPDGKVKFFQTDFLWSMAFRAHSEKE